MTKSSDKKFFFVINHKYIHCKTTKTIESLLHDDYMIYH